MRLTWLLLATLVLLLTGCGASRPASSPTALASVRDAARGSSDGEVLGRWLLGELVSPGGDAKQASEARGRLDRATGDGLLAHFARGLDDELHGELPTAPEHYLAALRAARASPEPIAPYLGWFAIDRVRALHYNAPGIYARHKGFIAEAIAEPVNLGWRTRGDLLEWWADEAYAAAQDRLADQTAKEFGCVGDVRLAGPFGRGTAADASRRFPAEAPGPWPARWQRDSTRGVSPSVIAVERQGCFIRAQTRAADGIYYAETFLELDGERDLLIAVQGALGIWINDQRVLSRDPRIWGVWPRYGVRVWLPRGRHRLLARLNDSQTTVRVMHPDGRPLHPRASTDASPGYSLSPPRVLADPNLLAQFVRGGNAVDPKDDLLRFVAAHLAWMEGQGDIATVLSEPLVKDPSRATGAMLTVSASFVERDPLFDRSQLRDLTRELSERAVKRDSGLWQPAVTLALWDAERRGPAEAVAGLERLAKRFPKVPHVRLALARLYGELGWSAERATVAKALAERFSEDIEALTLALEVYDAEGDHARADELVRRIRHLDADSEVELTRALARSDYRVALQQLENLKKRRPERKELVDRIYDVMIRAGNDAKAWEKLALAAKDNPKSGVARLALADAKLAQGETNALRAALVDAIATGAGSVELESALDLVEGSTQLDPYRIDALRVIRDYESSGRKHAGTAARVLDYAAIWVHDDGSSRMLEHEVVRIQSPEAIGRMAEHPRLEGLVLHMRVIKSDGRILEPEIVQGKPTVTFPHLDVGDYIETERILSKGPESEGGIEYLGPHWFFREENVAYARSELVLVTPQSRPLVIETRGQVPKPEITELDGMTIRRFRVDDSPAAPQEPGSAPITEFLPSVRVGWGISLENRLRVLADNLSDTTPVDPRIRRIARKIVGAVPARQKQERARRLYRWVLDNVEEGPEADGRRVVVSKNGNRWRGFVTLCSALGIDASFAVARSRLAPPPVGELERAGQFTEPLLRVRTESGEKWLTLSSKFAPFGYVPVEVRGVPAYVLGSTGVRPVTTPALGGEDGVRYEGTFRLATDGSATVELDQHFTGKFAMALRSAFSQLSEAQLRDAVETRLLGRALRGAHLDRFSIVGRDDPDTALVLRLKARMSVFADVSGSELLISPPFSPRISQLAALPARQTPLLISETTHQEVRLILELPAGAVATVAPPRTVKLGESVVSVKDRVESGKVVLERSLFIPAGRVQPDEYARFVQFARDADEALSATVRIKTK